MHPLQPSIAISRFALAGLVATGAFFLLAAPSDAQLISAAKASVKGPTDGTPRVTKDTAIRSFHIKVPEEVFVDLRYRLAATRWPDKETVADRSQGVQLATMQELVGYWEKGYNWRKAEARLNALPEFVTTMMGWIYSSCTFVLVTRMRCL